MRFDVWVADRLAEHLPAFLMRQRWFGSKARQIRDAAAEDFLMIAEAAMPLALVCVRVQYQDAGVERYVMPVAAVSEPSGAPAIGHIDATTIAVEASTIPQAARALILSLVEAGARPTHRGAMIRRHDTGDEIDEVARTVTNGELDVIGGEQSNTSIRVARKWIFKLIRKLEHGDNPEVEIGRFLSRTTFPFTPRLRGAWSWVGVTEGSSTLAVLQDWVAHESDGWRYVLARLADSTGQYTTLYDALEALGATTAALHRALASDADNPAFRPARLTIRTVQAWHTALIVAARRACTLLGRRAFSDEATRETVRLVLANADRLGHWQAPALLGGFDLIRIHGDYHLGQILKTGPGFVIIDFEGEPARPLSERRAPHAALRDIAGMLRSFDYAVETVRAAHPDLALPGELLTTMRRAFLRGYLEHAGGERFVPKDRGAFDEWCSFFELDKALYEVEYELNHRPDWVHIPLGGVVRLLSRS